MVFVKGMLDMIGCFHAIILIAMRGGECTQKRMRKVFKDFLIADACAANCLVVYIDELLRLSLHGTNTATPFRGCSRSRPTRLLPGMQCDQI